MEMEKNCKTSFSLKTKERCIAPLKICGASYKKIFTSSKLKKKKPRKRKRQRIIHTSKNVLIIF